jgi:DNA topoisomerase-2
MHLFNSECKLRKYQTVGDIIDDFYTIRMNTYAKRKSYLMKELEKRLLKMSNRAKYILETLDGNVDLRKKTAQQVVELLESRGYVCMDGDYKYLTKMPMDSVTQENVDAILKEKQETETELHVLTNTTIEQMWLSELTVFEKEYAKYKDTRMAESNTTTNSEKKPKKLVMKSAK